MDRRDFFGSVVGVLISTPFPTTAQQPSPNLRRIGFLGSESASNQAKRLEALRAGLRDLGHVEGKNIVIEVRWAEGNYDRLPTLAAELVGLNVSVVVSSGTKATLAMKNATTTIPIVMGSTGDPIALGLATSFARPGGTITGLTTLGPELTGKRLELLKEAMPRLARAAYLVNPADPPSGLHKTQTEARALQVELRQVEVRAPSEFDSTIAAMVQRGIEAIVVQGDTMFAVNARALADLAKEHRLPSAGILEYAEAGGMIGFGADIIEGHRRAATYVDKILKGAKPAELPIERATRVHLVLNLGTAKTLGIAMPRSLVARADEVIQ